MTTPGLHAFRLSPNADNPREVAFATQWDYEIEHHDILKTLLEVPATDDDPEGEHCMWCGKAKYPLGREPTERDRIIAATLMQWLGSNVGLSFVREALNRVGYDVKWPERNHSVAR